MIVNHIESGLGNQMLSYCEYLASKIINPTQQCFIETIIYEIPECEEIICQWNGYELQRIFGIEAPNISSLFSETEWRVIIRELRQTEFWKRNWNYPVYFTNVLAKHGVKLKNVRGDFEEAGSIVNGGEATGLKARLKKTYFGYSIKKAIDSMKSAEILDAHNMTEQLFLATEDDVFTGQRLGFKFTGNGIEKIEEEIKKTFVFPEIDGEKNISMLDTIDATNSVAIHARRGDMLGYNYPYYKFGYFKRAVSYVRSHVEEPVFVFFCDPGSVDWCRQNEHIFGLNLKKDKVFFTDWNKGIDSYRDMQLMARCKHQIITNSSFGWWAAFLNKNPNKITLSPEIFINTTHHC